MSDELPQGWVTAPLNQIAEINPRHPKDLDGAMPVTFVPMAALSESKPRFQFTEEGPLGEVRKGFTHFAERDVLFAKITPCMRGPSVASEPGKAPSLLQSCSSVRRDCTLSSKRRCSGIMLRESLTQNCKGECCAG